MPSSVSSPKNFVHLWRKSRDSWSFVSMATVDKQVMVVGIDDSAHSLYALEWTLDHLIVPISPVNSPFKLIVVHAKPSPSSAVSLAGPGNWFSFSSWFLVDWSLIYWGSVNKPVVTSVDCRSGWGSALCGFGFEEDCCASNRKGEGDLPR